MGDREGEKSIIVLIGAGVTMIVSCLLDTESSGAPASNSKCWKISPIQRFQC